MLGRIDEENVDFLRLQFTDILGTVKNVSIPASQAEKAFTEGIYFDGSSIEGFVRIQESDMRLQPDPDTFAVLPWRDDDEAKREEYGIETLPTNLGEAVDALEADEVVQSALGPHVAEKFVEAKRAEFKEYLVEVSDWELDRYLETF